MIVVGHRGVAGHYPENTRISIEAAIRLGLEWIEVDVQPSKDNVLVVCHDHTVDRCSNGSGRVDELNLAQLRVLNFAQNHKKRFPQQTIMTLAELLDLAITENVKLNLEVKVDHHDPEQVGSLLTEAIDDSHIQPDNILFSSFNHDVLRQLRTHFPSHAIAVLSERLR